MSKLRGLIIDCKTGDAAGSIFARVQQKFLSDYFPSSSWWKFTRCRTIEQKQNKRLATAVRVCACMHVCARSMVCSAKKERKREDAAECVHDSGWANRERATRLADDNIYMAKLHDLHEPRWKKTDIKHMLWLSLVCNAFILLIIFYCLIRL